mgnify:FL=1|tara:strand:- start:942 stop:1289 length:348 start_codon:yes stop_codon:yes gene_type:complete
MISYSTNWMGPVSTRWYEERDIPFVLKKTSGKILPVVEYKDFLESYSCGRIDIYGLDDDTYWCGKSEYSVAPMLTEDWNAFGNWLDNIKDESLITYEELIRQFEEHYGQSITWST